MSEEPLLSVRNLEKHFPVTEGLLRRQVDTVRAVDGISFDVHRGEAFGLVGESGCGKSTTALSILQLEEPSGGEVLFEGENVAELGKRDLRRYRRQVQLVLQDPESAFNDRMSIAETVAEPLRVHGMTDSERRREVVEDALGRVGLGEEDPDSFPHEFSGGEKQRIAIARALVLNPDLIIADEPVSALDGRTKSDVLSLLKELQTEFDLSVLLISHDIDVVRQFCDRVAVMYLGSLVESGPTAEVVENPHHPYTQMLLGSVPSLDPTESHASTDLLTDELPDAADLPSGCQFHPRCPAIIPPAEVDLPREAWLGVVAFRLSLTDGYGDIDAFRRSLSGTGDLDARVRETFDIPSPLPDADIEAAVTATVGALDEGDLAGAGDRLTAATESVCERHTPELQETETSHPVACHRYDDDEPGKPETEIQANTFAR
ncbi:peptide/nickel transport system ATP-binding protein [Halovenus aranensis]|uniref:Peptide/nickel transport system ATP-binding protein n=1 Tax=Halovenus aranensis TaxID=890420 RepID=A0A1G8YLA4_9EURY|nr:oligopeptide/dipeptide ABC transporter ATP-binding protein [Halovenus aranensis]SDK03447.1 peptide/nickel transport system ATP-binding protein [Halovenus aranensis]